MDDAASPHPARSTRDVFWALGLSALYLLLAAGAIWAFRNLAVVPAGNELSLPRSVFTVANAASLTGFQQTIAVETYKPLGQTLILLLIICGSLFSMVVAGVAVVRLLRWPYAFSHVALAAVVVQFIALAVGTATLLTSQRRHFDALFLAASAFGNCGVFVGPAPSLDEAPTYLAILPLGVIGGLGLPVILDLFAWILVRRRLSMHSHAVLAMSAGVYLLASVALMLANPPPPAEGKAGPASGPSVAEIRRSVVHASTGALNTRTLGLPLDDARVWPRATVWLVMVLMLIGASPAGTGGGIKTTTLAVLARGGWRAFRGRAGERMLGFALLWVGLYLLLVLGGVIALSLTEPQLQGDRILFIAISALGNVGLSPDPISVTGTGLYVLSIVMLLGRMLPMVLLWTAALTVRDADVAVG